MLTKEKLLDDLTKMDPKLGDWAESLIEDGKSVQEVLDAMQRMVEYTQRQ